MNITNKKILVTGGAGFIGSNLCENSDVNSIVTKLKEIVPEYISQNSNFEKLDDIRL